MHIYDVLVELSLKKGVSVSQACKDMGMSHATANQWKTRGSLPTKTTLRKIEIYFDLSHNSLMSQWDGNDGYGFEVPGGLASEAEAEEERSETEQKEPSEQDEPDYRLIARSANGAPPVSDELKKKYFEVTFGLEEEKKEKPVVSDEPSLEDRFNYFVESLSDQEKIVLMKVIADSLNS